MPFSNFSSALSPILKPAKAPSEIIIGFVEDKILITCESKLPHVEHFEALGEPKHRFDIGIIEQIRVTLHIWDKETMVPPTLVASNLRAILNAYPMHVIETLSRAKQLVHWLLDNVYCGRCGDEMQFLDENGALTCKACGHICFPRISPACIVLVRKEDKILLARSPHFAQGIYSLLAGFVEAGESAEACAIREVKEEVGITIKNLRYFGTQSWSFPHSLMIGFFAEYESGELCLQEEEIEDARWFSKESMPPLPYSHSIAFRMIQAWLDSSNT